MKVSPAGLKPGVHTAGQMASGVAGSWPGPPWSWPRAPSLPTHKDGRDDARPQQSAGSTSRRKPTLRFEASFWGCRSRGRRGRSAQGLLMDSAWTGHLDFHPYFIQCYENASLTDAHKTSSKMFISHIRPNTREGMRVSTSVTRDSHSFPRTVMHEGANYAHTPQHSSVTFAHCAHYSRNTIRLP